MNLLVSISFSFLFLMQSLGPTMDLCCEFQKIPVLVEHYKELEQVSGISILSFLDNHYGDGTESGNIPHQDEHDSKLPFHGQHRCSHGQIFMVTFFSMFDLIKQDFIIQKRTDHYNFSITSEYLDTLFQPPRV